jgi:endonuclease/exonuclease/phosphatase family metal-dependent hydrolase
VLRPDSRLRLHLSAIACVLIWSASCNESFGARQPSNPDLKVMCWNIWHGGRENGEAIGPQQVAAIINESGADIVALQETYGSGERLADATGFLLHACGTNVSILSRYPLVEDISVFEEFKCVGGVYELPGKGRFAFYSIWLPYATEIWEKGTRNSADQAGMLAACELSAFDLSKMLTEVDALLNGRGYSEIPVILAGDFNSMSHLDYTAANSDQFATAVEWPTSLVALQTGFRDSYRETHPVVDRLADRTWSPRFPEQEQDRIDFIYWRGGRLDVTDSSIIDKSPEGLFPSDHAALVSSFTWRGQHTGEGDAIAADEISVGAFNIRHGRGLDEQVDLKRTGSVIASLDCDIAGIQEVDFGSTRSGRVNQTAFLGRQLGMYGAFSKFMDFQGGEYGIAIFSRLPVRKSWTIPLPDGAEPRSAAAVSFLTRHDQPATAISVHFDWIDDDSARYEQARALVAAIGEIREPVLVVGDFNDTPDSRTMALFREIGIICDAMPATWPAGDPEQRIDFIVAIPKHRWEVVESSVLSEREASDHRPIKSVVRLLPEK